MSDLLTLITKFYNQRLVSIVALRILSGMGKEQVFLQLSEILNGNADHLTKK